MLITVLGVPPRLGAKLVAGGATEKVIVRIAPFRESVLPGDPTPVGSNTTEGGFNVKSIENGGLDKSMATEVAVPSPNIVICAVNVSPLPVY